MSTVCLPPQITKFSAFFDTKELADTVYSIEVTVLVNQNSKHFLKMHFFLCFHKVQTRSLEGKTCELSMIVITLISDIAYVYF